jgi:hypothetical protein
MKTLETKPPSAVITHAAYARPTGRVTTSRGALAAERFLAGEHPIP